MIHNRVLAAGIIFCLLFTCIVWILVTDQNYILDFIPDYNHTANSSIGSDPSMNGASDALKTGISSPLLPMDDSMIAGTGVIIHENLEGGFFGIVSEDGRKFLPDSLPPELQINGTRVIFSLKEKTDSMSVYMWGIPVSIVSIQPEYPDSRSFDAPLITFERAGGVTGGYESLIINSDGSGEVHSPAGITRIMVSDEELGNISRTVNASGFSHLLPEYLSPRPVPDAVIYTITIGNSSVKMVEQEVPLLISPLNSVLLQILNKNLGTQGTANNSAE